MTPKPFCWILASDLDHMDAFKKPNAEDEEAFVKLYSASDLKAARLEGMEEAVKCIEASCVPCGGNGMDGDGDRCQYCGRPVDAIRAAMGKEKARLTLAAIVEEK